MPQERRRVFYSGRVQGVGFRFTSERLARSFKISGYVRNLADGRVELVAEGETTEVESFLDSLRDALGEKIRAASSEGLTPGEPEIRGFEIRY